MIYCIYNKSNSYVIRSVLKDETGYSYRQTLFLNLEFLIITSRDESRK